MCGSMCTKKKGALTLLCGYDAGCSKQKQRITRRIVFHVWRFRDKKKTTTYKQVLRKLGLVGSHSGKQLGTTKKTQKNLKKTTKYGLVNKFHKGKKERNKGEWSYWKVEGWRQRMWSASLLTANVWKLQKSPCNVSGLWQIKHTVRELSATSSQSFSYAQSPLWERLRRRYHLNAVHAQPPSGKKRMLRLMCISKGACLYMTCESMRCGILIITVYGRKCRAWREAYAEKI